MRSVALLLTAAIALALASCGGERPPALAGASAPHSITLRSSAFENRRAIPPTYTCDGTDVSPPISWMGGPPAAAYALIVTDPDAPGGSFTHWVVFDIAGSASSIAQGEVPPGAREGSNGFGHTGYGGPCPPRQETHTYVFTLYALNRRLPGSLQAGASAGQVIQSMRCCIEGVGTLTGIYQRPPQ